MADVPTTSKTPESQGYDITEELFRLAGPLLAGGAAFLRPGLSDIAVILLAGSLLERILRLSLIALFRKNVASKTMIASVFEGKGPLATFSAKIDLCVGLGYIADVRHDLKIISKVRNDFAHSAVELQLKDYSICRALKLTAPVPTEEGECIERQKFKQACAAVSSHICQATLLNIAKDRFVAANRDGVMLEYAAMLREARISESPTE